MKRIISILLLVVVFWYVSASSLLLSYPPGVSTKPAEPEIPPPVGEGVLNLYGIDPLTLDPALSGEMTSHGYVLQIFSGLVCLDDNLEPAPDIAERLEVSQDGMTYTFYLRQDVKFQSSLKR